MIDVTGPHPYKCSVCTNYSCENCQEHMASPERFQPKEHRPEVIFMGDKSLIVDPSVPKDMILFPDEETRQWFQKMVGEVP